MCDLLTAFSSLEISQSALPHDWTITSIEFRASNDYPTSEIIIEQITLQYLSYILIVNFKKSTYIVKTLHIECTFMLHERKINAFLRKNLIHLISTIHLSPNIQYIQSRLYDIIEFQSEIRYKIKENLMNELNKWSIYMIERLV